MNQLSKEDRAKVFALYLGSNVMVSDPFNPNDPIRPEILVGVIADPTEQFYTIKDAWLRNGYYFKDSDYKLSLYDLSDITGEDANSVLSIIWQDSRQRPTNGEYMAQNLHLSLPIWIAMEIQDFLRSRSYALPYKSVNLFDAGIAIRKTR